MGLDSSVRNPLCRPVIRGGFSVGFVASVQGVCGVSGKVAKNGAAAR